ncbi:MAG TPA: hypothetical protein VGL56_20955 [Fimbriimonadaceae bacterium]|jgi:hypothetical protein
MSTDVKFHSQRRREGVLARCRTHGIPFEKVEAYVLADYILVEPGSRDLSEIDIGRKRVLENPSELLDEVIAGVVSGKARAIGKPLLEDIGAILPDDLFK